MTVLLEQDDLEGRGTAAGKDGAEGAGNTVGQGELELGVDQLLDVRAADLGSVQLLDLDDVDGAEAGTVAGSQVLVYTKGQALHKGGCGLYSKT